jgi:Zn-dependent M16 (insulinase) family peptidase
LAEILATLSSDDLKQLEKDAETLKALQEKDEDVSSLPTLTLEDVPPTIESVEADSIEGVQFSTAYDKATSDILYFTCPAGAGNISTDLFSLVPFFCNALTNSGTRNRSYEEIARFMDLYTGGVSVVPFSGSYFSKEAESHSFIAIQGKTLERNIDKLFDLVSLFVESYSFNDFERIANLLLQYQAGLEASIVSTGHRFAISLASRHLSRASYINELWHGIAQYQLIKGLTEQIMSGADRQAVLVNLSEKLNTIAASLMIHDNFKPALIGSREAIIAGEERIKHIHDQLPNSTPSSFFTPDMEYSTDTPCDGWYTNTAVSFVGQSFKTVRITHEDSPGLAVISKLLRSLFLHREIREKGGAYGGFAMYNTEEGIFSFGSYRDPHIKRTLDVYKQACDFIIGGNFSQTDIKESILQVCSEIDKPETPGPAAMKAFYRKITKLDDAMRQQFKDELLRIDKKQIQTIAETYFTVDDTQKGVAVISSKPQLEAAQKELEKENRALNLYKI